MELDIPVNSESLRELSLEVSARDENCIRKDVLIGIFSVSLRRTVAIFSKDGWNKESEIALSGDLVSPQKSGHGGKLSGKVEVNVLLKLNNSMNA